MPNIYFAYWTKGTKRPARPVNQLTQDTLVAAAVMATAFGLEDAAKHFTDRALSYGPLRFVPSFTSSNAPATAWNFGSGVSGVVE